MKIPHLNSKLTKSLLARAASWLIAANLLLSDAGTALASVDSIHTLSPVSGIKPIASVEKQGSGIGLIIDAPEHLQANVSEFVNNFRFKYFGDLIGKAFASFGSERITAEKLNKIVEDEFSRLPPDGFFSWGSLYKNDGSYRMLVTDKEKKLSFSVLFTPSPQDNTVVCRLTLMDKQKELIEKTPSVRKLDGYISKGSRSLAKMNSYINSEMKSGRETEMDIDLSSEIGNISSRLDNTYMTVEEIASALKKFYANSDKQDQRSAIKILKECLKKQHLLDLGKLSRVVPAQVTSDDDFALGIGNRKEANYYARELIENLDATLREEYILHEMLCPLIGHVKARVIQSLIYPENYPKKGDPEGTLRVKIRKFIEDTISKKGAVKSSGVRQPDDIILGDVDERMEKLAERIGTKYPGRENKNIVIHSFKIAKKYHGFEFFAGDDTEMYIEHVLAVAEVLERWGADTLTISAALLHKMPTEKIRKELGIGSKTVKDRIVGMVERLADISHLPSRFEDMRGPESVQNYMNMIIQMTSDPEEGPRKGSAKRSGYNTLLLVLADKLMAISKVAGKAEQKKCFDEIVLLYAPLAERIGLINIASELRSEGFRLKYPDIYDVYEKDILNAVKYGSYLEARTSLEAFAKDKFEAFFREHNIEIEEIRSRVKSPYSVWEKVEATSTEYTKVEALPDILGIMVVLDEQHIAEAARLLSDALYNGKLNNEKNRLNIKFQKEPKKGYEASHFSFRDTEGRKYELMMMDPENYRRYRYGTLYRLENWMPKPHWIYNLTREEDFKAIKDSQILTPDEIEHGGNFAENYELLRASLGNRIFVIITENDTFKVLDLPVGARPVDISAHPQINKFKSYNGLYIEKKQGERFYWHLIHEDAGLASGDIVKIQTGGDKSPGNAARAQRLLSLSKKGVLLRTKLMAEELDKKYNKKKTEERGKNKVSQTVSIACKGPGIEGHNACETFSKSLWLSGLPELYAAIGCGLLSADALKTFLTEQTERQFEVYIRNKLGVSAGILTVLADMQFNLVNLELPQDVQEDAIGRAVIKVRGPAHVTNFDIYKRIMNIKYVKSVRVLGSAVSNSGNPSNNKTNSSKKRSHRFPRIIKGRDIYTDLKKNLAKAGYDRERIKNVMEHGIYRVSAEGLEEEDDSIIEIARKTLSDALGKEITRKELEAIIVDNHEYLHNVIDKTDVEKFKTMLKSALSDEKYATLRTYYQNMYGAYSREEEFLEELAVNYFMERSLYSQVRLLPDASSKERVTLFNFDARIENLIEEAFSAKVSETGYYEKLAEKIGKRCGASLGAAAFSASRKNGKKDIIVGIDTSLIPKEQLPIIQDLLVQLERLNREKGLEHIVFVRENGLDLAGRISSEIGKRNTDKSHVIVLGAENVISAKAFDYLRDAPKEKDRAFFAAVRKPEGFPDNSHLRLLDMIRVSLELASGRTVDEDQTYMEVRTENERFFIFIPRVEPMDYNILEQMYKGQLKAMMSV